MKSNFLAEKTNNFGDGECESQNTRLSDGGDVVGNVSSKKSFKKVATS